MTTSGGVGEQHARSAQNMGRGLIIGSAGLYAGMNIWPGHVILRLGQQSCGSTGVDSGSWSEERPLHHLWLHGVALLQSLLDALEPGVFVERFMPDGMTVLTLHVHCTILGIDR